MNNVFDAESLAFLLDDLKQKSTEHFLKAGIGRDGDNQLNDAIRQDFIYWLEENNNIKFYFDWIEQLRQQLNQSLCLGLFDYECHYAQYPPEAFYRKHLDAFKGEMNRRLTTILYLNPVWGTDNGGELLIYAPDNETVIERVMPRLGTVVIFLSEKFPHEVLATGKTRYSLTGWYHARRI